MIKTLVLVPTTNRTLSDRIEMEKFNYLLNYLPKTIVWLRVNYLELIKRITCERGIKKSAYNMVTSSLRSIY